ncbi:PREDICTED: uncharacterized protein LOC107171317 [Diuraphis noxia]|uniref:uncharacterized protein LOC107171317 n=1 Tax=Diuraphis noxia TaxID=143948 RepID=UPI00076399A9|nr:PREDICTED: uncharacterized protein LOC107171317 [Diuraphis noxia]
MKPPASAEETDKPITPADMRSRATARPSAILATVLWACGSPNQAAYLTEVHGDQEHIEAVRAEVARFAGPDFQVKSLQRRALVEILDLDQWTSSDKVTHAVARAAIIAQEIIKVVSLRKRFGGSQLALVSLPRETSRKLINAGRLRTGMVSCRVRMADTKVRCFRCLAFGHTSNKCEGPDRTACCRRCGEAGHKAANCSASDQAVSAFARVVEVAKVTSS